jgi:hypothetical protein
MAGNAQTFRAFGVFSRVEFFLPALQAKSGAWPGGTTHTTVVQK